MIRVIHPGSRIQGSKRHPIPDPDPQHCFPVKFLYRTVPTASSLYRAGDFCGDSEAAQRASTEGWDGGRKPLILLDLGMGPVPQKLTSQLS